MGKRKGMIEEEKLQLEKESIEAFCGVCEKISTFTNLSHVSRVTKGRKLISEIVRYHKDAFIDSDCGMVYSKKELKNNG